MLDEKRLWALHIVHLYQTQILREFNKKVKARDLQKGDIELKETQAVIQAVRGKLWQNWQGLHIIKVILQRGVVKLIDIDRDEYVQCANLNQLKKYYAE